MSKKQIRLNKAQKKTESGHLHEQGSLQSTAQQSAYQNGQINHDHLTPVDMLSLQHTIGNQAVQRLVKAGRIKPLPEPSNLMPLPMQKQSTPSPALALRDRVLARAPSPTGANELAFSSPALQMRAALQTVHTAPKIQRDIKDSHPFGGGELEINFTKFEGTVPGDSAGETGTIKFTPNKSAHPSKSLRFVQIVRNKERNKAGKAQSYKYLPGEKDLEASETKRNPAKNIAGGFFVDREPGFLKKRAKKADPNVAPYYDVTGPPIAGNVIGKTGKVPTAAVLDDTPSTNVPLIYHFVTSVKGSDNNVWYGTVLWGFETYHDKAGITKVKGEYKSFRSSPGSTMKEALKRFNKYYRNKGSSTAPRK
jgi:hypothetical protein